MTTHVDADDVRVTQRPSYSCSFCTSRKIRCSKTVPCDTCIRRGHPETCERKASIVRGRVVNGPASERAPELSTEQLNLLHLNQLKREVAKLRKDNSRLQRTVRRLPHGESDGPSSAHGPDGEAEGEGSGESDTIRDDDASNDGGDDAGAGLGGLKLHSPPPDVLEPFARAMGLPDDKSEVSALSTDGSKSSRGGPQPVSGGALTDMPFRETRDLANVDLISAVPTPDQSRIITRASFLYTSFMHCGAVHAPTWLAEHESFLDSITRGEGGGRSDAWLSGYFAIISVGLYYVGDFLSDALGLPDDLHIVLAEFYFDVCIEALERSNFMSVSPTFEALQTIVILPVLAHNFGSSAYVETLLHVGIRIAQTLRLHILGPERLDNGRAAPGLIRRELGRRIWLILRMSETRPDFARPATLIYPPGLTVEPLHANDEDMKDDYVVVRPLSQPTVVSHMLCAGRRSKIFRKLLDTFSHSPSQTAQYAAAVNAAATLRANLRDFAPLQNPFPDDSLGPGDDPCEWTRHARYIWGMLQPSGTILVYRSFLGRAYVDRRYDDVRQKCLAAAREILALRKASVPPMFARSWFIASYTVLAGVVLATELAHGRPAPALAAQLRDEIAFSINSLRDCGPSSLVAQRGTMLLERAVQTSLVGAAASAGTTPGSGGPSTGAAPTIHVSATELLAPNSKNNDLHTSRWTVDPAADPTLDRKTASHSDGRVLPGFKHALPDPSEEQAKQSGLSAHLPQAWAVPVAVQVDWGGSDAPSSGASAGIGTGTGGAPAPPTPAEAPGGNTAATAPLLGTASQPYDPSRNASDVEFPPAQSLWPGWGVNPAAHDGGDPDDVWTNAILGMENDGGWWADNLGLN
ncbi:hypothetical protein Q5752_004145 [Cryptotrichosporon argae]